MKRFLLPLCLIILITDYIIEKYMPIKLLGYDKETLRVKLINHGGSKTPRGLINDILKERYNVKVVDDNYDMVFDTGYCDNGKCTDISQTDNKAIKIYYTLEARLADINKYDLSIGFDHIDNPKYFRLPFYYMANYSYKISADYDRAKDLGQCNPHKPYFACFLVSNNSDGMDGCAARTEIFHKLSAYKRVESGGRHLNNIGKPISKKDEGKWLSKCKFVIAYENQSNYDGYITEKPFLAYFSGAVPIYYGNKVAIMDLNKKSVIYAGDFDSPDTLVEYIKKVDSDNKLYCDIWNQSIITDPNENYDIIREKLKNKIFEVIDAKLKNNYPEVGY